MSAALAHFFTIVERDHARTRSVAHYASAAGISTRRLGELLEAQGKPSAKQIICERVVLEQKRRLAHSDISIKELAALTGFDEPTNMVKFFRHFTGTTPNAFRALNRADRRFLPFRRGS
jgi:AraC family transcriptional activator of pobA